MGTDICFGIKSESERKNGRWGGGFGVISDLKVGFSRTQIKGKNRDGRKCSKNEKQNRKGQWLYKMTV